METMDRDTLHRQLSDTLSAVERTGHGFEATTDLGGRIMDLLFQVFAVQPLGEMERFLDQAMALAKHKQDELPGMRAELERGLRQATEQILHDPRLAADPGARLDALQNGFAPALASGDLLLFADLLYHIGQCEFELERHLDASVTLRRAIMLYERLHAVDRLALINLTLGQVYNYLCSTGPFTWDFATHSFDDCLRYLGMAQMDPARERSTRAACLIDRVPGQVEQARAALRSGRLKREQCLATLEQARDSVREGMALAEQAGNLQGFVRQGQARLAQIDDAEELID